MNALGFSSKGMSNCSIGDAKPFCMGVQTVGDHIFMQFVNIIVITIFVRLKRESRLCVFILMYSYHIFSGNFLMRFKMGNAQLLV